jgi:threonylcarbamoyladenosine tRNA methylthiotransferase MtaB
MGYSDNYLQLVFEGDRSQIGEICRVKVMEAGVNENKGIQVEALEANVNRHKGSQVVVV